MLDELQGALTHLRSKFAYLEEIQIKLKVEDIERYLEIIFYPIKLEAFFIKRRDELLNQKSYLKTKMADEKN